MVLQWFGAVTCLIVGVVLVVVGVTVTGAIVIVVGLALGALALVLRPIMQSSKKLSENIGMPVSRITGAPKLGASMAQANEKMAAAVAYTAPLMGVGISRTGLEGSAMVVSASDTGRRANLNPVYEVELDVTPVGGGKYRTTVTSEVNSLAIAQCVPGTVVSVRIDQNDTKNVWIDWLAVSG